jgi:membrane associated rhomboid family serine protease
MTLFIVIITAFVSILALNRDELFRKLRFHPYSIKHHNEWTRFFTYAFVHADWIHLGVNMFVLYNFGRYVELDYSDFFGAKATLYYLMLYTGGVLFSTLPSYSKNRDNPLYSAVGASGAVSAVLFASIIFNPTSKIFLFFIPIGIPAAIFGIIYLAYSAYMSKKGHDNIGHDAHFWGAIYGIVFTIALKPPLLMYFLRSIAGIFGL